MWTVVSVKPEEAQLVAMDQPLRKRWSLSVLGSAAGHIAALLVLCWPVAPIFVKPNLIARGAGGTSTPVSIALYLPADTQVVSQSQPPLLSLPVMTRQQQLAKLRAKKRTNLLEEQRAANADEAGSKQGTELDGPAFGDEVIPALVQTFPDPKIQRSEIPSGVQGDVVVEITIDVQGNVVEERLLKGIGYGIDERVIAAVRGWRFRPATRNGVPIPSKHDVLYHFPS